MGKTSIWAGRILSGLVAAFFLLDGTMKLVPAQVVIDTMKELGWPGDIETARLLGFLTLGSAVLYLEPKSTRLNR
jgi:DoxX-like family